VQVEGTHLQMLGVVAADPAERLLRGLELADERLSVIMTRGAWHYRFNSLRSRRLITRFAFTVSNLMLCRR
jgi:hypothetical protein